MEQSVFFNKCIGQRPTQYCSRNELERVMLYFLMTLNPTICYMDLA